MSSITVIGAGNSGLAMAAHLSLNNPSVRLWNRSSETIEKLKKTKMIYCDGVIKGKANIDVVTDNLAAAIDETDLILVTTPASSHREIAERLSPLLRTNRIIILNPGRTFGALEFEGILRKDRCRVETIVAETQTIVYTCRKIAEDSVIILGLKKNVLISAVNCRNNELIINALPACLKPYVIPAKSIIQTSIGNVGMILHCTPVLFNIGWIESHKTMFKYYYEGITPSIAGFLEDLDSERVEVSKLLGKRVETTTEWLRRSYGVSGNNLYECIQNNESYKTIDAPTSLQHRYILEDIPCGLVPLEAIGKLVGLPMKLTGLIIDLASEIVKVNFRKEGRNLKRLGLEGKNVGEIRSILNG